MAYTEPSPQTAPEWFSSSPDQLPPSPAPGRNWRHIVLVCIVASISLGIAAVVTTITRGPSCLSAADYKELTGTDFVGTLEPKTVFYATAVTFLDSGTLDTASQSQVASIARFYEAHSSNSLRITLDSSFVDTEQRATALQNVTALQKALTDQGVDQSVIVLTQPRLVPTDEDIASQTIAPSYTISITSLEGCR